MSFNIDPKTNLLPWSASLTERPWSNPLWGKYVLNAAGEPELARDIKHWRKWMDSNSWRVALDTCEQWCVSTVFLGTDHSAGPGAAPLLFETVAQVQAQCAAANAAMHGALARFTRAAP